MRGARSAAAAVLLLAPERLRPARQRPAGGRGTGDRGPGRSEAGEGPRLALSPDNVHIEYRVLGHGEPAVLLVHGWACDANYWNEQLEALKAHYTVVAINLAGHGGSGSNRSEWSIANYAADVAAVATADPEPAPGAGRARDGGHGGPGSGAPHRRARQRDRRSRCAALGRSAGALGARHRAARGPVPRGLCGRDAQAGHQLAV